MTRTGIALVMSVALVLALALTAGAAPTSTSMTVYPGWNMIALPTAPIDYTPGGVFANYSGSLDYNLTRWDPIAGSMIDYCDLLCPAFGNMLVGDGYWLFNDTGSTQTFAYDGADVSGDHWVSLPKAGWTLIGYPNLTPDTILWETLKLTDGIETKAIMDVTGDWVDPLMQTWDAVAGSMVDVGDTYSGWNHLDSGRGYWVYTYKPNLALIVPGS